MNCSGIDSLPIAILLVAPLISVYGRCTGFPPIRAKRADERGASFDTTKLEVGWDNIIFLRLRFDNYICSIPEKAVISLEC